MGPCGVISSFDGLDLCALGWETGTSVQVPNNLLCCWQVIHIGDGLFGVFGKEIILWFQWRPVRFKRDTPHSICIVSSLDECVLIHWLEIFMVISQHRIWRQHGGISCVSKFACAEHQPSHEIFKLLYGVAAFEFSDNKVLCRRRVSFKSCGAI